MADVKNIKIVPVTSLETLAGNEKGNARIICSMIDARNDQVYCGIFDEDIKLKEEYIADDINVVSENLKKYDDILFVGDGAILHKDLIEKTLANKSIRFSENNKQNALSLGIVAYEKIKNGAIIAADELVPMYLRKSQAERMKNESKDS